MSTSVTEFWFDPICPWTWITSRWMAEVSDTLNLNVQWQPFSLKVLNENNKKNSDGHEEAYKYAHLLGQILMLVKADHGNEGVAALYTALGTKIHVEAREYSDELIEEALAECAIATDYLARARDENGESDEALRQSTARGIKLVGRGVGVPIIAVDEKAFFGPVVSPAPKGEDALKLWQAVEASINIPGFSELKRGRDGGLDFS